MKFKFLRSIFKTFRIIHLAVFLILALTAVIFVNARYDTDSADSSSEFLLGADQSAPETPQNTLSGPDDSAADIAAIQSSISQKSTLDATAVFSNDGTIIMHAGMYCGEEDDTLNIISFVKKSEHVEEPLKTTNSSGSSNQNVSGSNQSGVVYVSPTEPLSYSRVLNMRATAYTYCYNEMDIAANGQPVQVGLVAADFSVIPMNTRVYIAAADGSWVYGYAIVGDTGVKGDVIDLFMTTTEQCFDFGVQNAVVYILD